MKFHKPMLAKNYEGNEHRVVFPCYVQPKLDGIRCITDGRRFWSRNGKLFPLVNLKHLQTPLPLTHLVDGELMVADSTHFEEVVSAVKNGSTLDRSLAERIQFHVFDVITDDPYVVRRSKANFFARYARVFGSQWFNVFSVRVGSVEDLTRQAKQFLRDGNEGTMIRSVNGRYVSTRTLDLLKWKPLQDAEFPIVGVREAKGKDAGTPIFICQARSAENITFSVRPMGTMAQRRKMWKERRKLIGQWVTIEYQNLTRQGKPRFPRAKVLRDYE